MSSTAVITTYQRIADADWVRPDMPAISRGVFADGIANTAAGLLGTFGLTVSTANVGLAAATGVVSRPIGFVVAAILCVLAFQPNLIGVLVIMPPPVMAAALLFTAVFIMIGGVQIISIARARSAPHPGRRHGDDELLRRLGLPHRLHPRAGLGAAAGHLAAGAGDAGRAGLNLIFRIGIRRTVTAGDGSRGAGYERDRAISIERKAGVWGARRDVTLRVQFGIQQFIEAVIDTCAPTGLIGLSISYDEFSVAAAIDYAGAAFELPHERPTEEEIIASELGARRLAGYLIRNIAEKALLAVEGERHILRLVFDQ